MLLWLVSLDEHFTSKGKKMLHQAFLGSFIKEAMIKNLYLPIIVLIILKYTQGSFIYFMSYIYKIHKNLTL